MSGSTRDSVHPAPPPGQENLSTSQLLGRAMADVNALVRDEVQLAKVEIQQTVRETALGASFFGAAGLIALYGVGALITTLILALAVLMPLWLAALVVAVVLLAVAGIVALMGKKKVDQATPPLESTKANVVKDVDAVKGVRS